MTDKEINVLLLDALQALQRVREEAVKSDDSNTVKAIDREISNFEAKLYGVPAKND